MTIATYKWNSIVTALSCAALTLLTVDAHAQEKTRPKNAKARLALLESEVDAIEENLKKVHGTDPPDSLRTRMTELQSKLDEMSVQLSKQSEESSKLQEGNVERDKRLDDFSEELAKLQEATGKLREEVDKAAAHPPAGYENGFFIRSKEGRFQLSINGFVRPYYQLGIQKTWETDEYGNFIPNENGYAQGNGWDAQTNSFGMANARFSLTATVLDVIHGVFEIDYGTLRGTVEFPHNAQVGNARYNRVEIENHTLRFLDVYGAYTPFSELNVRLGQFKVPFDLESQFNANFLTFTSRSLMTRAYAVWGEGIPAGSLSYNWDYDMQRGSSFGRDTGLELSGNVADGLFKYGVGIFNGAGDNVLNDNRDFLIALRLSTEPAGEMSEGMSDLTTTKSPLVSIGAGFAYDLLEHQNLVDPLVSYNSSDINVTADVHFKWYGASLLGAFFYRHSDHGSIFIDAAGDDAPINGIGTAVQLAYFNKFTGLEPGVRYSVFDADLALDLDHVHELTAVISYYPFLPHLKISAEYRGLFPAQTDRTYLRPWGVWYDHLSEITLMAQVSF